MLLATLALAEATTLGAEVRVLGGSADQSENVVRYTDGMVDLPTDPGGMLLRPSPFPLRHGYPHLGVRRCHPHLALGVRSPESGA